MGLNQLPTRFSMDAELTIELFDRYERIMYTYEYDRAMSELYEMMHQWDTHQEDTVWDQG